MECDDQEDNHHTLWIDLHYLYYLLVVLDPHGHIHHVHTQNLLCLLLADIGDVGRKLQYQEEGLDSIDSTLDNNRACNIYYMIKQWVSNL